MVAVAVAIGAVAVVAVHGGRVQRIGIDGRLHVGDGRIHLDVFAIVVGIDQRQSDGGHPQRLAVARSGEDDVFHAGTTQALRRLFAEHPIDRIRQVRLAATVGSDDRGNAMPEKLHLGAITERLKALNFDAFYF